VELTEALCLIPLLLCSGSQVVRGKGKEKALDWSCLSDLCLYYLVIVMLFLAICIMVKLVVLVSLDWPCLNNVIYDWRWLLYLNLDLCCIFRIVWLMYPVSVITYVLNILDTFNTGVTAREDWERSEDRWKRKITQVKKREKEI